MNYTAEKIAGIILAFVGIVIIIQSIWIFILRLLMFIAGYLILNFGLKLLNMPSAGQYFTYVWFTFRKNVSNFSYDRYR